MTQKEFLDSLNAEQSEFYNSSLITIREELQAMYAIAESDLVSAHAEIATAKDTEIAKIKTEKTAAETKAAEDLAAKEAELLEIEQAKQAAESAKVAAEKALQDETARLATEKAAEIEAIRIQEAVKVAAAEAVKQAAVQEVTDIYNLLGGDPNIQALKKQAAIEQADRDVAAAIKRKEELTKV